ncbi:hypothetical protein F7725_016883, partial [Dissostichus mawsoni]
MTGDRVRLSDWACGCGRLLTCAEDDRHPEGRTAAAACSTRTSHPRLHATGSRHSHIFSSIIATELIKTDVQQHILRWRLESKADSVTVQAEGGVVGRKE